MDARQIDVRSSFFPGLKHEKVGSFLVQKYELQSSPTHQSLSGYSLFLGTFD